MQRVFQLAHIARPAVDVERAARFRRQRAHLQAVGLGIFLDEILRQFGDVGRALAQRRDFQVHHVEAEPEVLAEFALAHGVGEVAVGSGDDADIDRHRLAAADAVDQALLDRAQQLRLQAHVHLGDFVQQQRAAIGLLELADAAAERAGEGAFLVAEQLGLQQILRDRRAIDRDERLLGALRARMQVARQHFLARAAFAGDQHGGIRAGDLLGELDHACHRVVAIDHLAPVVGDGRREMIYRDDAMASVVKLAQQIAGSDASVLITGESGTGKEVLARYLHARSQRAKKPFITVNCAAIPENLLESELFGHEKGAFTGALGRRIGKFEEANGGTLLLDEISEMDVRLQAKLLRAIQERLIDRVGGGKPVPVDIRIVATSTRNPTDAVREGKFREDLWFRLNVVNLKIPPLRERPADIGELAIYFIKKYSEANGLPVRP